MTPPSFRPVVVLGGTANMAFAIGSTILNFRSVMPDFETPIMVFHDGLSASDRAVMSQLGDVILTEYVPTFLDSKAGESPFIEYFSPMVFSKYECLKLLDTYTHVLWLDFDIVLQKDIRELFAASNGPFLTLPSGRPVSSSFAAELTQFEMNSPGMSSGTFVLRQDIGDYSAMHRFCESSTAKFAPVLKMPEQAIFDLMIQHFDLVPDYLDPTVYACHPLEPEYVKVASIVHCYGRRKFWSGVDWPEWEHYYQAWIALGGSAAPGWLSRFGSRLRRLRGRIQRRLSLEP